MFDVLNEKIFIVFLCFFLCTIQRKEISLIVAKAMPLVLNFCTTTRTVSWTLIIGFIRERIKKFDRGRK